MHFELKPIPWVWLVLDRGRLSIISRHHAPKHSRGSDRRCITETLLEHETDWESVADGPDAPEARGA